MQCKNCYHDIPDDSNFCPYCGVQIRHEDKQKKQDTKQVIYCPHCGKENKSGKYCQYCGTRLDRDIYQNTNDSYDYKETQSYEYQDVYNDSQTNTYQEKYDNYQPFSSQQTYTNTYTQPELDTVDSKINWKIVIVAVLVMLLVTGGSYLYLRVTPGLTVDEQSDIQSSLSFKTISRVEKESNIANSGLLDTDEDYIYTVNDPGYLVKIDKDFKNAKVLVSEKVTYINVYKDRIYYCNENTKMCSINKDGSDQKQITEDNVFYMLVHDDLIYYQNDTDNESLYVYDIKEDKHTKLLDQHIYNMSFDDEQLYFNSKDGFYKYTDKSSEKLINEHTYNGIVRNKNVYYFTSSGVKKYSLDNKKTEDIVSSSTSSMVLSKEYMYAYTEGKIYKIDSKNNMTSIYSGYVSNMQIINDQLVFHDGTGIVVLNTNNGQTTKLFK